MSRPYRIFLLIIVALPLWWALNFIGAISWRPCQLARIEPDRYVKIFYIWTPFHRMFTLVEKVDGEDRLINRRILQFHAGELIAAAQSGSPLLFLRRDPWDDGRTTHLNWLDAKTLKLTKRWVMPDVSSACFSADGRWLVLQQNPGILLCEAESTELRVTQSVSSTPCAILGDQLVLAGRFYRYDRGSFEPVECPWLDQHPGLEFVSGDGSAALFSEYSAKTQQRTLHIVWPLENRSVSFTSKWIQDTKLLRNGQRVVFSDHYEDRGTSLLLSNDGRVLQTINNTPSKTNWIGYFDDTLRRSRWAGNPSVNVFSSEDGRLATTIELVPAGQIVSLWVLRLLAIAWSLVWIALTLSAGRPTMLCAAGLLQMGMAVALPPAWGYHYEVFSIAADLAVGAFSLWWLFDNSLPLRRRLMGVITISWLQVEIQPPAFHPPSVIFLIALAAGLAIASQLYRRAGKWPTFSFSILDIMWLTFCVAILWRGDLPLVPSNKWSWLLDCGIIVGSLGVVYGSGVWRWLGLALVSVSLGQCWILQQYYDPTVPHNFWAFLCLVLILSTEKSCRWLMRRNWPANRTPTPTGDVMVEQPLS